MLFIDEECCYKQRQQEQILESEAAVITFIKPVSLKGEFSRCSPGQRFTISDIHQVNVDVWGME